MKWCLSLSDSGSRYGYVYWKNEYPRRNIISHLLSLISYEGKRPLMIHTIEFTHLENIDLELSQFSSGKLTLIPKRQNQNAKVIVELGPQEDFLLMLKFGIE